MNIIKENEWSKNSFKGWTCIKCGKKVGTLGEKLIHERRGCDNNLNHKIIKQLSE